MQLVSSRLQWVLFPLVTLLILSGATQVQAQGDIGSFEGAVWRFGLEPKPGNPHKGNLRGHFRVSDLKVYQAESPEDAEAKKLDKNVGESKPGPGKRPDSAILTLTDFKAWDRNKTKFTLSGKCRLRKGDEKGEAFGEFIDAKGYHWELKCKRVQE